jgi:hypothetical protein
MKGSVAQILIKVRTAEEAMSYFFANPAPIREGGN